MNGGTKLLDKIRSLIVSVRARPNMSYIVHFGPYRFHAFVLGDASPFLSLMPQNAYNMLATSTNNKVSYQTLTRRCGILKSTPLRSPTTPSAQLDSQWSRLWYQCGILQYPYTQDRKDNVDSRSNEIIIGWIYIKTKYKYSLDF
jgi:hypothetical protein